MASRPYRSRRLASEDELDTAMFSCGDCGQTKPARAFRWRSKSALRLTSQCRECWNSWRKERRKTMDPEVTREINLEENLAKAFSKLNLSSLEVGLRIPEDRRRRTRRSIALYEAILAEQGGRCAICGTTDAGGRGNFHIDHDHETNDFRGLLCHACNTALGLLGDDPDRMLAAAAYVISARAGQTAMSTQET